MSLRDDGRSREEESLAGNPLEDRVALVAGGTRGAGRGIAIELGAAGAFVYITGRPTAAASAPMGRGETIEQTLELVRAAGGEGCALRVDHSDPGRVRGLVDQIDAEHGGVDIHVNDVWGGDALTEWDKRIHEHDLANGLALLRQATDAHIITSWHAAPLLRRRPGSAILEWTDGVNDRYRGTFFYDLAKHTVIRLAVAQAEELRQDGVYAIAVSPGFMRSERVLDHLGVAEENWRDGIACDSHFAASETPWFTGRAIVALASDPDIARRTGGDYGSWRLAREYGFDHVDGRRPDWDAYCEETFGWEAN